MGRKIIERAAVYGIGPEDIILDGLCMTVSSDSKGALTTLETLRRIKLLRALENRQITRIGSVHPVQVDFRLISATNKNLMEKVERGEFRKDLYYRINAFRVVIPPLR